jgi:hypothetical protein
VLYVKYGTWNVDCDHLLKRLRIILCVVFNGYLYLVSLGRRRRTWEDNIKMGLQEVGEGSRGLDAQAEDRDEWRTLVNAVMKLRVP